MVKDWTKGKQQAKNNIKRMVHTFTFTPAQLYFFFCSVSTVYCVFNKTWSKGQNKEGNNLKMLQFIENIPRSHYTLACDLCQDQCLYTCYRDLTYTILNDRLFIHLLWRRFQEDKFKKTKYHLWKKINKAAPNNHTSLSAG